MYVRDNKEFRASVARMRAALDEARTVDLRPYGRQDSDFDNTLAEQAERPALRKRSKWAAFIAWLKGE
jgi:DNA-binding GntR family transcriptional regulator